MNTLLPVEVVFHPSWWNRNAGIVFDEDFFYDPRRRVEDERKMEQVLHDRFGRWGLGADRDRDLPQIGAVHNAAGYLLSEMLGCEVRYGEATPPEVVCARREGFDIDVEAAFESPAFRRLVKLIEDLKTRHGFVCGDVNWGGVLNLAMDLKGEDVLVDMMCEPEACRRYFNAIAEVVERFFTFVFSETGTTSVSVNRLVRFLEKPVFLHSECSHTMISEDCYREFLMPIDIRWANAHQPFGIHHCGKDPHRFAKCYAELPRLDFLDVGWGGDLAALRAALPNTFLSIRLNPVELNGYSEAQLERIIEERVRASANPALTGVCCINLDDKVADAKVDAIFRIVDGLRKGF